MKQLPELWRRGIVTPLTKAAADEMATFFVSSEDHAECLAIDGEAMFSRIWSTGLIQDINHKCGTRIDDYEEDVLPVAAFDDTLRIIAAHRSQRPTPEIGSFLEKLEALIRAAKERGFPVYFIL